MTAPCPTPLLPCPFCGSSCIAMEFNHQTRGEDVWCDDCEAKVEAMTMDEAVALWNRRTPLPAGADRQALEYLMQQFDYEVHYCDRCGAADPTKDCDSANYLRDYLAKNPAALSPQAPASDTSGRDAISKQIDEELASRRPAGAVAVAAIDECEDALRGLVNDVSRRAAFGRLRASLSNTTGLMPGARAAVNTALAKDPAGENPAPVSLSPQAPAGAVAYIDADDLAPDQWDSDGMVEVILSKEPTAGMRTRLYLAAPPAAPSDDARDAARYRYLRDVGPKTPFGLCATDSDGHLQYGAELDAAIEAAVRGKL